MIFHLTVDFAVFYKFNFRRYGGFLLSLEETNTKYKIALFIMVGFLIRKPTIQNGMFKSVKRDEIMDGDDEEWYGESWGCWVTPRS